MGIGVTPERFKQYLADLVDQDYLVIGVKDSPVAHLVAKKLGSSPPSSKSVTIAETELDMYLVKI